MEECRQYLELNAQDDDFFPKMPRIEILWLQGERDDDDICVALKN